MTTSPDDVEAVARAIWAQDKGDAWDETQEVVRRICRDEAEAAIAALEARGWRAPAPVLSEGVRRGEDLMPAGVQGEGPRFEPLGGVLALLEAAASDCGRAVNAAVGGHHETAAQRARDALAGLRIAIRQVERVKGGEL